MSVKTAGEFGSLSVYPLDNRCALLTNFVWEPDCKGTPSLHRQKLWVQFPESVRTRGLRASFYQGVGRVRVETAEDAAGTRWRTLAEAEMTASPQLVSWPEVRVHNLRVHVVEPTLPHFPISGTYFDELILEVRAEDLAGFPAMPLTVPAVPLEDRSPAAVEPFAGQAGVHVNEELGICHRPPRTNRLAAVRLDDTVEFASPVFRIGLNRRHARVTHLGWDTFGQDRVRANLLSTAHTQGAFPVVMRGVRRFSSEASGGTFECGGRRITYRGIRPVPEIAWNYTFDLHEKGFRLDMEWDCAETFCASEIAALRIPFDLYRSVVNVLAMPDTTGPSGLVSLPLVINAPNHGVMRVTAEKGARILARILPFRTRAELWLDLMLGAEPLASGLFRMPAGRGRVSLEFELTRIFPGTQHGFFGRWELPPFYSFAALDNILGPLCDAWLNGLAFRPDLGRFANNSVADSASACAMYYAEVAAYTPMLAEGLDPRQFIRVAAEQILCDVGVVSSFSDWRKYPTSAVSPIECAWLYVAASGDWAWAAAWRDEIGAFTDALMSREWKGTGLVAAAGSGCPGDADPYMNSAWCDSIRSGHLESYNNALAYRALQRAAELLEPLGDAARAANARAMAGRLKAHFLPTFLDEANREIMMWVDTEGRRYGFGSHMHLGAAVAMGLVPDTLARTLLEHYLDRLAARGFDRQAWGLPIFLEPIPPHLHNDWKGKGVEPDGSDQVGIYMNGAVHTHQAYYILQALYRVGLRHQANELFMKMTPLVRRGELCGGLHSGLDWRHPADGRPTGYEGLLAEQFHFLLAAITGFLGCELTIDGLVVNGPDTGRIRGLRPNFARMASPREAGA